MSLTNELQNDGPFTKIGTKEVEVGRFKMVITIKQTGYKWLCYIEVDKYYKEERIGGARTSCTVAQANDKVKKLIKRLVQ